MGSPVNQTGLWIELFELLIGEAVQITSTKLVEPLQLQDLSSKKAQKKKKLGFGSPSRIFEASTFRGFCPELGRIALQSLCFGSLRTSEMAAKRGLESFDGLQVSGQRATHYLGGLWKHGGSQ